MDEGFRLFPEQASTLAPQVDALYWFLILVSGTLTTIIAGSIVFFAIKYRRGSKADRTPRGSHRARLALETAWIVIPVMLSLVIFTWAARLFFVSAVPPPDALTVNVVGRQWMWKFQHPEGNSEINELHVPARRPVKLSIISEDVIHSVYVPAFRVKHDVLPDRYSSVWFEATKPGQYHLFCAEYCGAEHARMRGRVVVLEPSEYQTWLSGDATTESPVELGQKLFERMRCGTCHRGAGVVSRGPPLANLYSSQVTLRGGQTVLADENYLRESILQPAAKVVAGYEPIMPAFEGQIGEQGVLELIAYLKSLANQQSGAKP